MSLLKVLTIGSNPNIVLYTWRLLQSGLVEVYHVSDHPVGQEFCLSTANYGRGRFFLDRHYSTVEELAEARDGFKFDVVIFSASSLQEMSSVACKLDKVIDSETKVFIESSGYVHLEPFVRLSANIPQLKVFSIMTDTDFRKMGKNTYEQFNANRSQTIFLGQSGVKSKSVSTRYTKDIATVLLSFQSFFKKLFPYDTVDLCNSSYLEFLVQQWKLAIPQICFDPLLILMEELKPLQLKEQVLAKPLISGFVTEVITLSRSMGVKLPPGYGSESELFNNWVEMNKLDVPKLAHQFLHRSSSMNIDMLLLQPILLADDHGIKTPYLEFLYSMMCQYQRMNDGNSQWFKRKEIYDEVKCSLESVTAERNTLASEIESLKTHISHKEASWKEEVKRGIDQANLQIEQLRAENDRLQEELIREKKNNSKFIYGTTNQGPIKDGPTVNGVVQTKSSMSDSEIDDQTNIEREHTSTGTPNLQDIQEFALYGINYNDSMDDENINLSPSPIQNGVSQEDISMTPPETRSASDHSLQERELEIKRRENMLQERELQLQRKIQHSNSLSANFAGQPFGQPHQNITQPMFLRRASKTNQFPLVSSPVNQYKANGNFNRKMVMTSRANSLVEPFAPQTLGAPLQQPYIQALKKTDRKTRQMARIRNASSIGLNDFSMHGNTFQGSGRMPAALNQARPIMGQTQRVNSQLPSAYPQHPAAPPLPIQKQTNNAANVESIQLNILPQFPSRGMQPPTPTSQPSIQTLQVKKETTGNEFEGDSISVKQDIYTTASVAPPVPSKPNNGFEVPSGNSATNSVNGYITPGSSNNGSSLSNDSSVQPPSEQQQPPDKHGWRQTPPSSSGSADRRLKLAIFSEKSKQKT